MRDMFLAERFGVRDGLGFQQPSHEWQDSDSKWEHTRAECKRKSAIFLALPRIRRAATG